MVGWFGRLRRRDDRGASLVEFALIMPLLLLLVLGTVEAAWAFANNLDVRHGAREGARLIAVNADPTPTIPAGTQTGRLVNETCDRMDMAGNTNATVEFIKTGTAVGDSVTVTVSTTHDDLTGFLSAFGSITLSSTVEIRIEQIATWADNAGGTNCP
jgi:Flp pilus assembly protein TadG